MFLKILKIELPYDPAIPLLGIYSKEVASLSQRDIFTSIFIALFIKAKAGNNLRVQQQKNE